MGATATAKLVIIVCTMIGRHPVQCQAPMKRPAGVPPECSAQAAIINDRSPVWKHPGDKIFGAVAFAYCEVEKPVDPDEPNEYEGILDDMMKEKLRKGVGF